MRRFGDGEAFDGRQAVIADLDGQQPNARTSASAAESHLPQARRHERRDVPSLLLDRMKEAIQPDPRRKIGLQLHVTGEQSRERRADVSVTGGL
jgi:hypothetical protein